MPTLLTPAQPVLLDLVTTGVIILSALFLTYQIYRILVYPYFISPLRKLPGPKVLIQNPCEYPKHLFTMTNRHRLRIITSSSARRSTSSRRATLRSPSEPGCGDGPKRH